MMYPFNAEEINLIAAFDTGNRTTTLELMEDMEKLLSSVRARLQNMTDEEYSALDLAPEEESSDA
jgi:hypothetical protein